MPKSLQITRSSQVPALAAIVLIALFGMGVYVVGYDQGQLFSLVEGSKAFDIKYLHELSHDMRHASGFPCH